jgi:hypothetical protein
VLDQQSVMSVGTPQAARLLELRSPSVSSASHEFVSAQSGDTGKLNQIALKSGLTDEETWVKMTLNKQVTDMQRSREYSHYTNSRCSFRA